MNVKKALATGAVVAAFALAAVPAFAHRRHRSEDQLLVENRNTRVTQNVDVDADTGDNSVSGSSHHRRHGHGGGDIDTGNATVGLVDVYADVNRTEVEGCGCFDDVTVRNTRTRVRQEVDVDAETGENRVRGHGDITTGDADVEEVAVYALVNTTMVGGSD